jgi:hypothetical protein
MPVTYLLVNFLEDPNMAYNSPHKCNMQLKNYHFQNIMLKAKNSIIIYLTDVWSTWTILNAKYYDSCTDSTPVGYFASLSVRKNSDSLKGKSTSPTFPSVAINGKQ